MPYEKIAGTVTIPTPAATAGVQVALPWDFGELIGANVLLTGTDTAIKVRITDADSRIVFLDAVDRDYKTAAVDLLISPDATQTGLSTTHVDMTGAALTIGLGNAAPPVRGPLTVDIINGGTAGDVITFSLYLSGPLWRSSTSLTVPTPAATVNGTLNLRSKFAQLVGITALLTGTDTAIRLQVKDADSRIVFLDAIDRDYKTAKVHLLPQQDDTLTGLGPLHVDATGAAATATAGAPMPVIRAPLTLSVINGGTAGDVVAIDVYYRM